MTRGVRIFLEGILEGGDGVIAGDRDVLDETPDRVAEAFARDLLEYQESLSHPRIDRVEVAGAVGPVFLRDVSFTSVCSHHLLPYRGLAHVGFVPGQWHVGLGGIARVVDWASKRLTLQEGIAARIADVLHDALAPASLSVVLEAEHSCLSMRGAKKAGHRFVSVERRGESDGALGAWEAEIAASGGSAKASL